MRLGVLDVGSNTVHLLVVDAHRGGHPDPMRSEKTQLRLAEQVEAGRLTDTGAGRLVRAVARARATATIAGCEELLAFATSALREADNSAAVLARVRAETGVDLKVLSGEDEARYTFLAVRRWYGWSAGRLLVLDIGGGSLELAVGRDEDPDVALSLPLGAGRLTRQRLPGDPPARGDVSRMASPDLADLDGVSPGRAHQLVAGALVAGAAMRALEINDLQICPWALREGVILHRLDTLGVPTPSHRRWRLTDQQPRPVLKIMDGLR
ncbi:hypothetical protein KZ829_14440 [Actinoplanes hulinensis]|uniref:Ppx/GppA phosphatase N-terminal domain-containing protein n=1 Tax=Actinoplanes hulinensis TaxID=1144547 RepID=A0ABS7B1P1_9ACTN|nr:hypothetical protein [Actinoplanes hulinensis]MBW6434938.1 hypothetical protein [Actinoplanes hulinensis]